MNMYRKLGPLLLVTMIGGCGTSAEETSEIDDYAEYEGGLGEGETDSPNAQESFGDEESRGPFDEDAAREAAEDEVASDSYQSIGSPYGCTDDCSGHEAGFAWRRDNGYSTPGNSNSFYEGGQAFDDAVEEAVDEKRDDYENGGEPEY